MPAIVAGVLPVWMGLPVGSAAARTEKSRPSGLLETSSAPSEDSSLTMPRSVVAEPLIFASSSTGSWPASAMRTRCAPGAIPSALTGGRGGAAPSIHPTLEEIFDACIQALATPHRSYRAAAHRFLAYLQTVFPQVLQPSELRRDPHLIGWLRALDR